MAFEIILAICSRLLQLLERSGRFSRCGGSFAPIPKRHQGGTRLIMKTPDRNALLTFPILLLIGFAMAYAGGRNGVSIHGVPLFTALVAMNFIVQWLAFLPAWSFQSEKFFDLTGSVTYILIMALGVLLGSAHDSRSLLLLIMVVIWAVRLGTFLFSRIHRAGKDDRFDELKPSFFRYLNVWTIQALWVTFTLAAALVAVTTRTPKGFDVFAGIGCLIWVFGFTIEALADAQKRRFRADPKNSGRFIHTGLWSRSRHPNYFGEIALWIGVAIVAAPVLDGWQWIAMTSPVFVTLLLTKVSGVPLLEKKADKKWGGQKDYEAYKARTPVLIPKF